MAVHLEVNEGAVWVQARGGRRGRVQQRLRPKGERGGRGRGGGKGI